MNWIALLLSLTLLVATHELGHLFFAKLFHTRVRRYYVFFNYKFSILKAKKFDGKWHFLWFNAQTPDSWDEKNLRPEDQDNTLWGLGWIPLGGYCDIAGMIDETKKEEDLEAEPQPWEYRTKPAWQRLCIISGGVLVNFVSALLLYAMILFTWGQDELPLRNATYGYHYHEVLQKEGFHDGDILYAIDGRDYYRIDSAISELVLGNPKNVTVLRDDTLVSFPLSGSIRENINRKQAKYTMEPQVPFVIKDFVSGSAAAKAGLQKGDSVVSIAGEPTLYHHQVVAALKAHAGEAVTVVYYRQGQQDELTLDVPSSGRMGVLNCSGEDYFDYVHLDYGFFESFPEGISQGWDRLVTYVSSLKMLFEPGGVQNLGGFGAMASLFPDQWSWQAFWILTALLALILAFMNIIPIPGLDGGHIVFTLWEIITRRKPSDKFLSVAQNVGMCLLLALMVLANGNDIWRWLSQYF